MYRDSYQRGLLTIFFSCGSKPLNIWDTYIQNGYITKFLDEDIRSTVLEIGGSNVSTTYMICPKGKQVLGITMPFLVMIVKNLKKYFSFEITILDDTGTRRRFRVSNFQSTTQILPLCTVMPISLSDGWNQIQFNMFDFCRRAYQKQFVEVQKCKINANIRIRRIYFADRILPDDKLPSDYKLFIPLKKKSGKDKPKTDGDVEALEKVPSAELKTILSAELKKVPSAELKKTGSAAKSSQEVGKRSSKEKQPSLVNLKKTIEENTRDETIETEKPVATDEKPIAADGETVAVVETVPEEVNVTTTETVETTEEPVAEAEAPTAIDETEATEGDTKTNEPVKESVEAATQYEPVLVEDKATDAAQGEIRTQSGRLETIEETE